MYRQHELQLSRPLFRSTSFFIAGVLIGLTIVTSTASSYQPANSRHVVAVPPADTSNSSCETETLAYAAAYANYESSIESLNDAADALYACQYGGGGGGQRSAVDQLAGLPSVLESR